MSYQITEPHPTVLPNQMMRTGRGGAGNIYKNSPSSSSKSLKVPSKANPSSHSPSNLTSTGRGGAGNIHAHSDLALFSFDEELARQASREGHGAVCHVGRGGAGNWMTVPSVPSAAGRRGSGSTTGSGSVVGSSGVLGRVSVVSERF